MRSAKFFLLVWMTLLLGLSCLYAQENDNRWVIAIGISEYEDGNFTALKYCVNDVNSLVEYFKKDGVPTSQILTLTNEQATKDNIFEAIKKFEKKIRSTGRLFFFISGHGSPDPSQSKANLHYFLTYDTQQGMPETALNMQDVKDKIAKLNISEAVLLLDTCHSGGCKSASLANANQDNLDTSFESSLRDMALVREKKAPKMAILSSSRAYEKSQEREEWKAGAFTHFIMKGLQGEADQDKDGKIRVTELSDYVEIQVKNATERVQNPISNFSGNWKSNIIFGNVAESSEVRVSSQPPPEKPSSASSAEANVNPSSNPSEDIEEINVETSSVVKPEKVPTSITPTNPDKINNPPANFTLELTTNRGNNKPVYYHRDVLELQVKVSKACYLHIYYLQNDGSLIQIFPNKFYKNDIVLPNKVYKIPDPAWGFKYRIDCSKFSGEETIKAFASLTPLTEVPGSDLPRGIGRSIEIEIEEVSEKCRKNPTSIEAECTIITKKK